MIQLTRLTAQCLDTAQLHSTFLPWLNRWKTNHSPSGVVFLNHLFVLFSLIHLNSDFIKSKFFGKAKDLSCVAYSLYHGLQESPWT